MIFTGSGPVLDLGGEQLVITEEALTGGWFNYDNKLQATKGKTLKQRAALMPAGASFEDEFYDVVNYINKNISKYELSPYDGSIQFEPNSEEHFTVVNQANGKKVNRERLYADIIGGLRSGNPFPIKVEYQTVRPTPPEEIVSKIVKRGGFSTHFESNPPRVHNIALAVSAFNGLVVNPGEQVSFNKIVGSRTAERGYQEAKIILEGEYVEGIGGGVCQVSTTVFNAAVKAGLHITESHNHSLRSHYVPLGTDAMVSSSSDLQFINNTGAPIYFATSVTDNRVLVKIFGKDKGSNIHYKLSSVTTKEIPPKEEIDEDETPANLLADFKEHPEWFEKETTEEGESGFQVTTYIETYSGEQLLSKKVLRKSSYKSRPHKFRPVVRPVTLPGLGILF